MCQAFACFLFLSYSALLGRETDHWKCCCCLLVFFRSLCLLFQSTEATGRRLEGKRKKEAQCFSPSFNPHFWQNSRGYFFPELSPLYVGFTRVTVSGVWLRLLAYDSTFFFLGHSWTKNREHLPVFAHLSYLLSPDCFYSFSKFHYWFSVLHFFYLVTWYGFCSPGWIPICYTSC